LFYTIVFAASNASREILSGTDLNGASIFSPFVGHLVAGHALLYDVSPKRGKPRGLARRSFISAGRVTKDVRRRLAFGVMALAD
jgi:hypothetical protein